MMETIQYFQVYPREISEPRKLSKKGNILKGYMFMNENTDKVDMIIIFFLRLTKPRYIQQKREF